MLKKILLGIVAVLVIVLVFHSFIIGTIVKPQVEQQLSKMLGANVRMNVLSVRLWPGSASIYGLKIKNPAGFSDEDLLDLGSFSIAVDVAKLAKEFTGGAKGPKTILVDHIKIKNLKLLVERIATPQAPKSNLEKLVENMNRNKPPATETPGTPAPGAPEAKKPLDLKIELKYFSFTDGKVTVRDATAGNGFEYVIDDIDVDVKDIFYPAKPADDLIETLAVSAKIGKKNPGHVTLKGRSNFMSGANIDAELLVKGMGLSDFNAFISDKPFEITTGQFDLESSIKILNNQLQSNHLAKLSSLELGSRAGNAQLIDLPLQTLLMTLNRVPSFEFPFDVNGDLSSPQFNVTRAFKAAIGLAIQKVLAGGLGNLEGARKELQGLATNLSGQALGMAGDGTQKITGDAQKIVQGLTGETTESLEGGLKKLSGFLGKVKGN